MDGSNDTQRLVLAPTGRVASPYEHWVRTSLAQTYAPVLHEELPADWLAMIRAAAERD